MYVDLSLTVPLASTAGMRAALAEALHLAPTTKVLLATDASRIPELFWVGARAIRRVAAEVLEAAVADGDLTPDEALVDSHRLLAGNARSLYGPVTGERRVLPPSAG